MLARARDRCKSARRRTGCDGDRIDARYRIADDRGAQGRWADMSGPQTRFAPPIRRVGGRRRGGGAPDGIDCQKLYSNFNLMSSQFYSDGAPLLQNDFEIIVF